MFQNNTYAVYYVFIFRINTEKEVTKSKSPSYPLGLTNKKGSLSIENISREYGQVEIERLINQRSSREHNEKQQAEAAVHQHFEESLKLAQQQRVSCIVLDPKHQNKTITIIHQPQLVQLNYLN